MRDGAGDGDVPRRIIADADACSTKELEEGVVHEGVSGLCINADPEETHVPPTVGVDGEDDARKVPPIPETGIACAADLPGTRVPREVPDVRHDLRKG